MGNKSAISALPLWWLRKIQSLWVKTKLSPESPATELGLKPGVPVCYVLPSRSLSDLLVLQDLCQQHGLPVPETTRSGIHKLGPATYIYLNKVGLLQVDRESGKEPPSPLAKFVKLAEENPDLEIQLVPVCVFWGRNPGREERSIMRLLFFDAEHAGILQKLFIVFAQGRNNYVNLGAPISLRALVDEKAGVAETAKKLRRVLRVHFRRQRNTVLGPSLPSRDSVASILLQSKALRDVIEDEARKRKVPAVKVQAIARRYIMEIACEQSYPIIRLAVIFFTWVWNRLFNGVVIKHAERLRAIEQTHELVYLPAHRSHLDYLLLAYSLYQQGLMPPHTAAGINLNFWPVGGFLRRAGAFYIRRTFNGNRLYTVVFNEYVHYLLTRGYSLKFYTEGGRSRTGRLLPAKTGMLAMVVHSYLRNSERPIAIVPIYVGYDKVVEVRTYQHELRGAKKRKESAGQLIKARRVLKTNFGKAYIGIAEPIYLTDYLNIKHPGWDSEAVTSNHKPDWMPPVVESLATEVLTRINGAAIVSPVSLLALILISTPTKAMAEEDLLYMMEKFTASMRAAPYSRDVSLPDGDAREQLLAAMSVAKVQRFQHPGGDVIFVEEQDAILLNYYRNNTLHLLAIPSLIAAFFAYNDKLDVETLVTAVGQFYPILKQEFFLRWPQEAIERTVTTVISTMVDQGLLVQLGDGELSRPSVTSRDLTTLLVLGRCLGQQLERYAIALAILAKRAEAGLTVKVDDYVDQVTLMAQRIAILSGLVDAEFYDKKVLLKLVDQLVDLGYLGTETEGVLRASNKVAELAGKAVLMLSSDIRDSIYRMNVSAPKKN